MSAILKYELITTLRAQCQGYVLDLVPAFIQSQYHHEKETHPHSIEHNHLLIKYIYLLSILIAGCPGFNNRLQCENGYKVDRSGCPISECGMLNYDFMANNKFSPQKNLAAFSQLFLFKRYAHSHICKSI